LFQPAQKDIFSCLESLVASISPVVLLTGAGSGIGGAFYDSFEQTPAPEDIAPTVLFALQPPGHAAIAQLVVLPVS